MPEQSTRPEWVGGPEKFKQEFKLLRSRAPLSADEIKTVCEKVKGFVKAFDATFGLGRLAYASSHTSGTQEAKELLDKIDSIESRADREAQVWDFISVKRLLRALGRAVAARWNDWTASEDC